MLQHFLLFECEMKIFVDSLKNRMRNVTIFCDNLLQLWQVMCKKLKISTTKGISLAELLQ